MSDLGTLLEREMQVFRTDYQIDEVTRRRDRRRRDRRVGSAVVALLLVAVGLFMLARAFRYDRSIPASNLPTGTIVFSRQLAGSELDAVFTIAADGAGASRLLDDSTDVFWVSPDARRVLFGHFDIEGDPWVSPGVVRLDGSDRRAIPIADRRLSGLMPTGWSPDGERFVGSGLDSSSTSPLRGVYTARVLDGGDLTQVTETPVGQHDTPIGFSPDGSRIALIRRIEPEALDANHLLYVVSVDGTGLVRLDPANVFVWTHHPSIELSGPGGVDGDSVSWSPDGSAIAFVGARSDTRRAVFVSGLEGTGARRITPWGDTRSAVWSPDGAWIAFGENRAGAWDLFVVHPDGSGQRRVTLAQDGISSFGPVWSPDSSRLLFVRSPGGAEFASNLWTAKVDGTELTQVTHQPGRYWTYAWSPTEMHR